MAFLQTSKGIDPRSIPDPPPRDEWSHCVAVPSWVMPMTCAVGYGVGDEAVNGIGFTALGDLLLYRVITEQDRDQFAQLHGIREVWIVFKLGEGG